MDARQLFARRAGEPVAPRSFPRVEGFRGGGNSDPQHIELPEAVAPGPHRLRAECDIVDNQVQIAARERDDHRAEGRADPPAILPGYHSVDRASIGRDDWLEAVARCLPLPGPIVQLRRHLLDQRVDTQVEIWLGQSLL